MQNGSVSDFGYTNNAIGNRTAMSRAGSVFTTPDTISYSYNSRSEVIGAVSNQNSAYNYAYNFDPIGNRLTANLAGTSYNYTANMLNQYTVVNSNQPTYDDDGNMLTNGNWTYTWNGENRLIRAVNSANGVKLEFAYDYMGRRIFKKVYNGETLEKHLSFVYDGYKLIEERNALDNNAAVRKYVWQPEALDRDVPLTVYDVVSEKTYYYHTDANKNVPELSDESGNVVAHYEYSPFGSLTKATGDYAATNPFRFSCEYFDEQTGLVYYNYRYYNPKLGRWISRDPIEEQGGFNLYGMIGNNPLYGWDDKGYAIETIWDICNVCIGVVSMVNNIRAGNYGEAAWDAGGVLVDAAGAIVPFVPSGVSAARQAAKAAKAADKAIDAARAADNAVDAASITKNGKGVSDLSDVKNVSTPHGNSLKSSKPQHLYEISSADEGVVKVGISGSKLNRNGTSPRANKQVNQFNKESGSSKYSATIVEKNIPGRKEALKREQDLAQNRYEDGNPMSKHIRPGRKK